MSIDTDRAAGALVGLAAGDALGAGYEARTPPTGDAEMIGGGLGGWAPGEWTDDTQMAICIAEVAATGTLDAAAIGDRFIEWYRSGPADVGIQTSAVLRAARTGADLHDLAREYFEDNPRGAAGNGSLMRTAPVALAHLGDDHAIADAAREISALTHGDPLAGDACVLWCVGIDRAICEDRLDGVRDGLSLLSSEEAGRWDRLLAEAETQAPGTFRPNGFVVTALQAAYAAIHQTDGSSRHLERALHTAVRIGHDTDTVAAIAGMLLGARWAHRQYRRRGARCCTAGRAWTAGAWRTSRTASSDDDVRDPGARRRYPGAGDGTCPARPCCSRGGSWRGVSKAMLVRNEATTCAPARHGSCWTGYVTTS